VRTAHLDYEGRSGVDITEVGSHRWSIDPRFELLMASVSRDEEERVYLWVNPMFRTPDMMGENEEAEKILAEADIVWAHNASNEQANTWGAFQQKKACPFKTEPPITIWRCSAAVARKAGLPYSLEQLCDTLQLPVRKDRRGKALIKLFCIPDPETGKFHEPRDHPDEWLEFGEYCRQDNRAEKAAGHKLKAFELTGAALATFQFDLRMNQRGIPINVAAARNAQRIIDQVQSGVTEEFRKLTGLNPTQREKVRVMVGLENMQAPTIEAAVSLLELVPESARPPEAIRNLRILDMYQKVSYAAVKKIQTMLDCVCPDGVVRGMFMYYGAGTGRWTAQKLQPQNFKKTPPWMREMTDDIYSAIQKGYSLGAFEQIWGDPLELIAGCIRNFIHAPREILDGDYSGVEARIIAWLAKEDTAIQEWREYDAKIGPGPYKIMASVIYGVDISQVTPDQREVGKRVVLGAGYQMGPDKFKDQCLDSYQLDLPLDLCVKGIKAFRQKNRKIVAYWYYLNDRAKEAVRTPNTDFGPFVVRKIAGIPYLLGKLPSGRSLAFPHPEIELLPWTPKASQEEMDDPEFVPEVQYRENVTYWGNIKGNVWGRVKLYPGKFAENFCQAVAADFMAHGAIVAEARGMAPFMLVHDQGLALRTNGQTPAEYEAALGDLPVWAKGFPMKVEAHISRYFKK
jgi:DNA polymerase bacteriophage-type